MNIHEAMADPTATTPPQTPLWIVDTVQSGAHLFIQVYDRSV